MADCQFHNPQEVDDGTLWIWSHTLIASTRGAPPHMWFAVVIELIVVALVHHCDDRPIAAMAGGVIAAELRRIEPGRHTSVEK